MTLPDSDIPKWSGLTSHKWTGSSKTVSSSSKKSKMAKATATLCAHSLNANLEK